MPLTPRSRNRKIVASGFMTPFCIAILVAIGAFIAYECFDRLILPIIIQRSADRLVAKLLANPKNGTGPSLENSKYGTVTVDAQGFRIARKDQAAQLRWSEIEEVHAYKRDLLTVDMICLTFKKAGEECYYEIHEEMDGYRNLLEALPTYLPRFTLEWLSDVAFPAFATNYTVIWKRPSSSS